MTNYSLSKAIRSVASSISINHLLLSISILSFLGFLDAFYLTILHYKNAIPPCTIGGCETVLTSQFATIGPIPISLFGVGFYLAVLVLTGVLYSKGVTGWGRRLAGPRSQQTILTIVFALTIAGLFIAIILVGIQMFALHQYCLYCLTSELIDFLLFDSAWWLYRKSVKASF